MESLRTCVSWVLDLLGPLVGRWLNQSSPGLLSNVVDHLLCSKMVVSFTPLSNRLSSLAKIFTLLSSMEWFFSFRCKWTTESWVVSQMLLWHREWQCCYFFYFLLCVCSGSFTGFQKMSSLGGHRFKELLGRTSVLSPSIFVGTVSDR